MGLALAAALALGGVACHNSSRPPPPELAAVSPASGSSLGGAAVTLDGANFFERLHTPIEVRFGGTPATGVVVLGSTALTCLAPPGPAGSAVAIEIEGPYGSDTLADAYTYHPRPTLDAASPAVGSSLGGLPVTLTGTGFEDNDPGPPEVLFGGTPALDVVVESDTTLSCQVPAGPPGATVELVISNLNGAALLEGAFSYHAAPTLAAPSILQGTSLGATPITLTGTGLVANGAGTNLVSFGGVPATDVVVLDDETLTCSTPPGPPATAVDIWVQNANGTAALVGGFAYFATPTLLSISPASSTSLGGPIVTLTGTGFAVHGAGPNTVTIGATEATGVTLVDDTTLTCEVPAGTAGGAVDLRVDNANGSATLAAALAYHPLPTLASTSPTSGTSLGASPVAIAGSGFLDLGAGPCTVLFDGLPASDVAVVDDGTIQCLSPAGVPGSSVEVSVSNTNGTAALAAGFRYHALPSLSSVAPMAGSPAGGLVATLSGSGFLADSPGPTAVTFGGQPATAVSVADDGTLTCVTPSGGDGAHVDVVISNANGSATLAGGFIYNSSPLLVAVTPPAGSSLGGTSVALAGTAFVAGGAGPNAVSFGGIPATSVVTVDDSTITCTTPPGTPGAAVEVRVSNVNGTTALAGGFSYHLLPALSAVAPASGSYLGGSSVTLTGSGFQAGDPGPSSVLFDGLPATAILVVDDHTLTCQTPAGTPGASVSVQVQNANGATTLAGGFAYNPLPTLVAVSPPVATSLGGTEVTLSGSGFLALGAGVNLVTFGGATAGNVLVLSDASLTCETPAGLPGAAVDVALQNANGAATLSSGFTYSPLPSVGSVTPPAASSLGGAVVTVTGTGFADNGAGTNAVRFGGALASGVIVVDDTTLSCAVPAGAAGAGVDVQVQNTNGTGTLALGFAYHPAPTLGSVTPASGTSLGGTSVTLSGAGFSANAAGANAVTFAGVAATDVVVLDDSTLTCTTPAGTAGSALDVVVSNANGSGSLSAGFTTFPAPTVGAVVPAIGTSLGGTPVAVTGTGFTANAAGSNAVTFSGAPATDVIVLNDTSLTCTTPAGPAGSALAVVVSNSNGSGALSPGYQTYPAPAVSAVTPALGTSLGGTSVTISGSGFTAHSAGANLVAFDGVAPANLVVVDDSTLTCTTPPGMAGSAVAVSVSNQNGSGSLSGGFTYYPAPLLSSISPSGGTSLGGTQAILSGTGFTANGAGPSAVRFGGVPAGSVTVLNDTTIRCSAPAGTPGTSVDVEVANANGSSSKVGAYAYHEPPVLTAVTPAAGSSLGGAGLTLSGSGFVLNGAGGNSVTVDGLAAATVVVLNDSTITCTAPAGAPGSAVDVVVTNGNGSAVLSAGFSYHPEPTVSSVSPAAGTSLGGTAVTVLGSGFSANAAGSNTLRFGGLAATALVVVDDSTITCVAPPGPAGAAVDVAVTNQNGTGTLAGAFAFHDLPTLTAASPAAGSALGGTSLTLTGSGFLDNDAGSNSVTFDGVAAANLVVVSDTSLTCDAPAGPPGTTVDLRLANANGSALLSAGFSTFPQPTLTAVAASSGPWAGGASVTLSGTGFAANAAGSNTVEFGGIAATSVVTVDDNTITCDTPAGSPASSVEVVLTNANGSATLTAGYRYFGPPGLTQVSPAAGTSLGGTSVTLSGSGFLVDDPGPNGVTFGGAAATNLVVLDDATLTCDVPAGPPGTPVEVRISNANGSASLPAGYAYHAEPQIASISPSAGGTQGGTHVTLSGRGYQSGSAGPATVTFGGVAATHVIVLNDTTLTCEAPAGAASSSVDVELANANGSDLVVDGFSYHPPPTLGVVSPASGSSLGGQVVTLTGAGFLANAAGANSVSFDGIAASEVVVHSDTRVTCETPPGSPGATVDVSLQNANGSVSLAGSFSYHALPGLSAAAPAAGTALGGTSITLTGSGFLDHGAGTNRVRLDGVEATGVVAVSDTSLTCDSPAGVPGATVDVVVTNENGTATLAGGFAYHSEPSLSAVAPASGSSLTATAVTLTGSGFQADGAGANSVTFGGAPAAAITAISDSSITCQAPAGAAGTAVDVVVENANGSVTLAGGFRYHDLPELTAVSPAAGSPAGGTAVTITGTGFQDDSPGATSLSFGGVAATSVLVLSDTSITCQAPAGTAGAFVDVVLANDNGSDTLVNAFTFYAPPALTGIDPDHGPEGGGAVLTLTGSGFQANFAGPPTVTFGGLAAGDVAVLSDSAITCKTPAGTAGTSVDVALSNNNGSDSLVAGYTYNPPPTLTGVAPATGTSLGGSSLTLSGTGFSNNGAGTNAVTIGGIAATSVVVGGDGTITCTAPAGAAGSAADVVVTNINGSGTLAGGYAYHPLPTLTGVSPVFGAAAGGVALTLSGSGFLDNGAGANSITVGGSAPTDVTVVDDTAITCTSPAGAGDTAADVVLANANGSATLAGGFHYNDPPTIGPVFDRWALQGQAFSYTPPSEDPDASDTPAYTSNGTPLPSWANLNLATGEISGTPAAGDVGVTTTGIRISIDDGNYSPVSSSAFDLAVSAAASALVFGTPPASNEPQDEVWTPFAVRVEDAFGNLVGTWPHPVTLTLTSGSGALTGTLTQPTVQGIATFDDLSYDAVGAISFELSSPGITGIAGTSMVIDPGPTTKLAWAVGPAEQEYRDVLFSYLVVEVQDAAGNRLTGDNTTQIHIALKTGPGTLSGTLSKTAVAGRAVFDDLRFNRARTIALRASSSPATTSPLSDDIHVHLPLDSGLPQVLASLDSVGIQGDGASFAPAISGEGRFLAFASEATNLVAGDSNGVRDIFVHDRVSGETERVSLDSAGVQADGASQRPSISADGRLVAFESDAANLVSGDSNAARDVFVHDRQTGATIRLSVDSSGVQADAESRSVALSASGRFAAFESAASNLVAGDANASRDVFLHDRASGETLRISVDSSGGEASGDSTQPALSHDGRVAAFVSSAADLVAGDLNGLADIFVRELASGQTTLASISSGGTQADGASSRPALSGDGNEVAFTSAATNLVAGDANGRTDVFVRDRGGALTTRVSLTDSGAEGDGDSAGASLSEDGDRIAFESSATNLVLGDSNASQDVFLHLRGAARTLRLSSAAGGAGGDAASSGAPLSADGLHGAYASAASDLVAGDANGQDDVFLRPVHGLPTLVAVSPGAGSSLGGSALTLTGTGFLADGAGVNLVFVGGAAATGVHALNDTTLTCETPAGTGGALVDVVVVNANGAGVLAGAFAFHPTPTVASLSPTVGPPLGGTSVTLTGTGFASLGFGSNSISFAGVGATNVVVVNDTTLTCTAPAGTAGASVDVAVSNANGTGILGTAFSYHPAPVVSGVAPSSGHASGGTAVTLTGSGFSNNGAGANAVTFGGVPAANVAVVDDATLTCESPAGTAGTAVDVLVLNDNGSGQLADGFGYHPEPAPFSLLPVAGSPLGGTSVTISGSGFQNGSAGTTSVTFGGLLAVAVVVVDDGTLTCQAPAGTPESTVNVVVTNGNGSALLASAYGFNPEPGLSGVAPGVGSSLGGTALTISGTGFQNNSSGTTTVTLDGAPATDVLVVNDTTLSCVSPAGPPSASVEVAIANGNGASALPGAFAYHPTPTIASISPASGQVAGGTSIAISGTGFLANDAGTNGVTIGGLAAVNVAVLNNTTLTCETPAGATTGAVDVILSNANGSATLAGGFSYNLSPTLTSVAPAVGSSLGGTAVTLGGTGFVAGGAGVNLVTFDGVPATDVIAVSDTTIICDTPAGVAGATVDVAVTNANDQGLLAGGFTYHPAPALAGVSPAQGSSLGGAALTISGTGFVANDAGACLVTIGGTAAADVVVVSDTTITCSAPAGTAGSVVDLVVSNHNGAGTLTGGFTWHPHPSVTALAPAAGSSLGGTSVILDGTGFLANGAGANTVYFGDSAATGVVALDDTTLGCQTPAGSAGASVEVRVQNANGSGALVTGFTYHPVPILDSISPTGGSSLGGSAITLTGSGFTANGAGMVAVLVGGNAATAVVVIDDTTLTCETPPGTAGASVAVLVQNANGSGELASAYAYHPAPTLTAVGPDTGSSLGGAALTLSGSGFTAHAAGPATVLVDGNPASAVVIVDDTTLTCLCPAGAAGAEVDVEVQNANGNAALTGSFTYFPTPSLASVSPADGTPLGGTGVTLSGTGFQAHGAGVNAVRFGGNLATSIAVVNDNTITCTTPPGTSGANVDVEVENANGTGTGSGLFTYRSAPAVTAVAPAAGSFQGGTSVTLSGSGFVSQGAGSNAVTFGGVAATEIVVSSDDTITCVVPAGSPGLAVDVTVANDNGSGSLLGGYQYHPAPAITAVTPPSVPLSGGTGLTVSGTGFTANAAGATGLTIGGQPVANLVVVSDSTLTCSAPPGVPGSAVDAVVQNANGTGTLAGGLAYHLEPTLTGATPSGGTSLGGTGVTLTGSGFLDHGAGTNAVRFGAVAATQVVVVDDGTLTCEAPAGTPGATVDVALSNVNGSATLAGTFSYHPTPTLTAVTPAAGSALGGTVVSLGGTGFLAHSAGANTVTFGGLPATGVTVLDDATLTCEAPAGIPGASVEVLVSNANGSSSLAAAFAYFPAPAVTAVAPAVGPSSGGTQVTISGSGFVANAAGTPVVHFGANAAANVLVVDDATLSCDVPTGSAGFSVPLAVANANGTATLTGAFTYHPAPTLASIGPAAGPVAGGTGVTLHGTGFSANAAGTNAVTIGGSPVTSLVVVDDTTLTCETPAGVAATDADVELQNANGTALLAAGFRYRSEVADDLDDDGIADLILGAPGAHAGDGRALVFLGHATALGDAAAGSADLEIAPAGGSGVSLGRAAAGDLDGDGASDLIVGAPGASAVYVFFGPQTPPGTLSTASADLAIAGVASDDEFGDALAVADLDGDGLGDLVVGAPGAGADDRGAVYLFRGGAGFAPSDASAADVEVQGAAGERFGEALACGDLDGDGIADFAGGAPAADLVYVFLGGPGLVSASTSAADATLDGAASGDGFGSALAIGDVGGDPRDDLIAGAPTASAGAANGEAFVFFGAASFASRNANAADVAVAAEGSGDRLGVALSTGDLNGDGRPELVVGASHRDLDGLTTQVGRVYVFLGGTLSPIVNAGGADAHYTGEPLTGEHFGAALAVLDLDDDGYGDLVVGAPDANGAGTDAGRVYVFLGDTVLIDRTASTDDATFDGAAAGDQLGASIADD